MKRIAILMIAALALIAGCSRNKGTDMTDTEKMIFRVSEIGVYPEYLQEYLKYAKDVGKVSVEKEPGVICIFPMQLEKDSTRLKIIEIYASEEAYKHHISTEHFQRYKQGTMHMVKDLDLVDCKALNPSSIPLIFSKFQNDSIRSNTSFLELAAERFSVRYYDSKPVEQEKIDAILEAARLAPTAKNNQPEKIYVLKSEEAIKKINDITSCAYHAPVVFLVCADENLTWKNPLYKDESSARVDGSIVGTHMMLEACEQGLGSCWVEYFNPDDVKAAFNIPSSMTPVLLLPVGYPADGVKPTPNHFASRNLDDMVEVL